VVPFLMSAIYRHMRSSSKKLKKRRGKIETREIIHRGSIALECKEGCGAIVENCTADTRYVTCWRCVAKSVAPPTPPKSMQRNQETRPRGWHFREYYKSPSGQVYSFGREVDDATEDTVDQDKNNVQKKTGKQTRVSAKRKTKHRRKR
jgi:hypothetical protein